MTPPEKTAWITATLAFLATVFAWAFEPGLLPHAWLSATILFAAWPLGSIALLLVHTLTGGRWGEALAPALRLGVATTPLLVPLFVPVLLLLPALYPWAAHPVPNGWYLNTPFFLGRVVFDLVAWCGLAALVLRGHGRTIAAPGLVLLGVTVNFAAIDLTMSLDPTFNSSAYGMLAASGMVLFALALAVALSAGPTTPQVRGDLGKLLLALVVLSVYLDFMQGLIVWQSDLVTEAPWYSVRLHGPWGVVLALIVLDRFVLPFAVLLVPRLQRGRWALLAVSVLLALGEVARTWWTVLPAVPRFITEVDLAPMVGVAALATGLTLRLRTRATRPAPAPVRHG